MLTFYGSGNFFNWASTAWFTIRVLLDFEYLGRAWSKAISEGAILASIISNILLGIAWDRSWGDVINATISCHSLDMKGALLDSLLNLLQFQLLLSFLFLWLIFWRVFIVVLGDWSVNTTKWIKLRRLFNPFGFLKDWKISWTICVRTLTHIFWRTWMLLLALILV